MLIFYLQLVLVILLKFFSCVHADLTATDISSIRSNWTYRCPCICNYDDYSRKQIQCINIYFDRIPVDEMDSTAQVNEEKFRNL